MRPIDYVAMSPRNRMLNALAGGGVGRLGVRERNSLGSVIGETSRAIEAMPAVLLSASAPLTPISPLRTLLATNFSSEIPATHSTAPVAINESVAERDVSTNYVNNQGALVHDKAEPVRYATGRETGFDPTWGAEDDSVLENQGSEFVPSTKTLTSNEIAKEMLKDPMKSSATSAATAITVAKPIPWGKVAIWGGLLGVGWMLWKGR